MSFHILYESTTADATDVNDNFYHIAQGSRLPMDGVAMGYTDNALDLGSSSVRWNNLICNNIDTASVTASYAKMPIVIADYTLPQAANEFEITGLNGDFKHIIQNHSIPSGTGINNDINVYLP